MMSPISSPGRSVMLAVPTVSSTERSPRASAWIPGFSSEPVASVISVRRAFARSTRRVSVRVIVQPRAQARRSATSEPRTISSRTVDPVAAALRAVWMLRALTDFDSARVSSDRAANEAVAAPLVSLSAWATLPASALLYSANSWPSTRQNHAQSATIRLNERCSAGVRYLTGKRGNSLASATLSTISPTRLGSPAVT
jgi:hypothetical protein